MPLYETNLDVVKSEMATFFEAFPEGTIWGNPALGEGYDLVLLGQVGSARINLDGVHERLRQEDHAAVIPSLRAADFASVVELLATYAGRGPDLRQWLQGAEINRDRNLRLQYQAGLGLNSSQSWLIYDALLGYRVFPEDLFTGSDDRRNAVRAAIELSP